MVTLDYIPIVPDNASRCIRELVEEYLSLRVVWGRFYESKGLTNTAKRYMGITEKRLVDLELVIKAIIKHHKNKAPAYD